MLISRIPARYLFVELGHARVISTSAAAIDRPTTNATRAGTTPATLSSPTTTGSEVY
jgi:hypothetical protein